MMMRDDIIINFIKEIKRHNKYYNIAFMNVISYKNEMYRMKLLFIIFIFCAHFFLFVK